MIFDALGRLALGQVSSAAASASGSLSASGSASSALLGAIGAQFSIAGSGATGFRTGALLSAAGQGSSVLLGAFGVPLQASGVATAIFFSAGGGHMTATGSTSVIFAGSTAWDSMLSQAETPIAYFAEIEPWVLTDRS
jgi:hypothetical protein